MRYTSISMVLLAVVALLEGGAARETYPPEGIQEMTVVTGPSGSSVLIGVHNVAGDDTFAKVMVVGLTTGVEYMGPTGRMAGIASWDAHEVRLSGPGVDVAFALAARGSAQGAVYAATSLVLYPFPWSTRPAIEDFLSGMFPPTRPTADVPCKGQLAHAKALGVIGADRVGEPRACQAHCAGGQASCAAVVERGDESRMYCYCAPVTQEQG